MLLPISWLKKYIDIDVDSREIADKITLSGSHVESITNPKGDLDKVVVGVIESIEKHPNADKLVICQVDVGTETIQIVTGAPNVFLGAHVPTALVGAVLAGNFKIKKSKFRGEESLGMFCSYQELGFDVSVIPKEFRDGVLILKDDTKPGDTVFEILEMIDDVIELEITPNRPDCLSIIGMARETAATFNLPLLLPDIEVVEKGPNIHSLVQGIEVVSDRCARYYSRLLVDVRIESSPQWLQNSLMEAGVRPINNIVDLTNYVMLELGQPLHAFDLDELKEQKIIVRQGKSGEILKTLDDVERKVTTEDILIADGETGIGLAGIMGGMDSEVTESTVKVLLEGANFDSESVRKSSRRFGLRTEASSRFERGLDPELAKLAVDRVCQLANLIGAATVAEGIIDVYPLPKKETEISLSVEKVNRLLGTDLPMEQMLDYLNRLQIVSLGMNGSILAKVPSFRDDLKIEEDLIEEIARLYGYHNIEPQPLEGTLTRGNKPYYRQLESMMKPYFMGLGYDEYMTYSFISPKVYDKLNLSEDSQLRNSVIILNPLGEEYSVMRSTLVANILEVLAKNANRGNEKAFGYEFGNTFSLEKNEEGLPSENMKLAIGFYGEKDFYYLKQTVEIILKSIGIGELSFEREKDSTYLHPGRAASVYYQGEKLGHFGEVHPEVQRNFGIKKTVFIGELDFEKIIHTKKERKIYSPLPKYPSTSRDFSFVLPIEVEMGDIKNIVQEVSGSLLDNFSVFDIYTGEGIDENKKSVAFTISYRSGEHTLTEEEVSPYMSKIVEQIEQKLQGVLRS